MIDADLSSLEVLGMAVKSEIEASRAYARLAERVKNRDLKGKLRFLEGEEEKHRAMLEGMYARSFPDAELVLPPRSLLPKLDVALIEETPVFELLKIEMEWEKLSEEFYAEFASRAEDERGKAMLRHLGKTEGTHYDRLKVGHDLLSEFRAYYDVEGFHFGDEMMHFGP